MLLGREFFARKTLVVAQELVGMRLVVRGGDGLLTGGRIVEVEAYLGEADPASHAFRGPTPRSAIMFGPAGRTYIYLSYGVHHCLNLVTEREGVAGAVLLRAIEPEKGRDIMAGRRGLDQAVRDREIAAGPGRLCRALGIDLSWNGLPVHAGARTPRGAPGCIRVEYGVAPPGGPRASRRIGISNAAARLYRFTDPTSPCLSR